MSARSIAFAFHFSRFTFHLLCFAVCRVLDGQPETRYNRSMELVQLKSLFAELKQKASDLRGFL